MNALEAFKRATKVFHETRTQRSLRELDDCYKNIEKSVAKGLFECTCHSSEKGTLSEDSQKELKDKGYKVSEKTDIRWHCDDKYQDYQPYCSKETITINKISWFK